MPSSFRGHLVGSLFAVKSVGLHPLAPAESSVRDKIVKLQDLVLPLTRADLCTKMNYEDS
jgi:hypothetical protein